MERLQNERLQLTSDLEELKNRLQRLESVKRELELQVGRLKRESSAFKGNIEAVCFFYFNNFFSCKIYLFIKKTKKFVFTHEGFAAVFL